MNSNIDVLKELEVKNKEIYINKLGIDLDTNLESLLIIINNIMNLLTIELTDKLNILSNNNQEAINNFQKLNLKNIIELINQRNTYLKEKVLDIDNINYKEELDDETKNVIEKVKEFYNNNVNNLINELNKSVDEFTKHRISDYLNNLYFSRFIKKIEDAIINMDNILFNNYQFSYQKYLNLNEKTLK